jgi:hypothetical protein
VTEEDVLHIKPVEAAKGCPRFATLGLVAKCCPRPRVLQRTGVPSRRLSGGFCHGYASGNQLDGVVPAGMCPAIGGKWRANASAGRSASSCSRSAIVESCLTLAPI